MSLGVVRLGAVPGYEGASRSDCWCILVLRLAPFMSEITYNADMLRKLDDICALIGKLSDLL